MGTIAVDKREQIRIFKERADDNRLLKYDGPDGEPFSYDFHIVTNVKQEITVERKAWGDFVQSFIDGKLDRQCSAVDLLIVEMDGECQSPEEIQNNAQDHLELLQAHMWVIQHDEGTHGTWRRLRRLADRRDGITIKPNQMKIDAPNLRWKIISSLPGINPYREVGGMPLGQWLEGLINWDIVLEGLQLDIWEDAIQWDGARKVGAGTRAKIQKLLED